MRAAARLVRLRGEAVIAVVSSGNWEVSECSQGALRVLYRSGKLGDPVDDRTWFGRAVRRFVKIGLKAQLRADLMLKDASPDTWHELRPPEPAEPAKIRLRSLHRVAWRSRGQEGSCPAWWALNSFAMSSWEDTCLRSNLGPPWRLTLGGTSCVGWKLFCGDERVAIVENTGFGLSFQSEGGGYRFNWNGYFHAGKGSAPLTADNLLERLPDVDDITEGQAQALADMLKAAVEMRNRGNPWLPNWRLKQMSPMLADSYLWRRFVADMASELPDTQRFWAAYTAKWFGR